MSDGCFYIGTRNKMLEVRAPSVNMPSTKSGWSNRINYLNGGASVRRSKSAHKEYIMTWNSIDRDQARIILDLADGIYGNGDIYWHDPFAADRNVLPQWWASPMQGGYDGLPLNAGERGVLFPTDPNTLNLPTESIEYDVALGTSRSVWIPIPAGYTAHVGAYGVDGTGGTLVATPTTGPTTEGAATALTLLDVSDPSRFTNTFSSANFDGVQLSLGGSGTILLTGIMIQVLRNGVSPAPGLFISGQGNSGCSFGEQPTYTPYSAALDKVGVVAQLVETGGWAE
jgi:hypothetical protein